jgi:hypothetical protein
MRKLMMMVGMVVAGVMAYAQGDGADPMKHAARQTDKMKSELSLDDVQYKSIQAIQEEYAGKRAQIRTDSALSTTVKRDLMKSLQREKSEAVKKVLTPEQSKKWQAYQKSQRQKHQSKRKQGDHAMRMQKILSLTDEQTTKVKALDEELLKKFQALRQDTTLTRDDFRRKVEPVRDEYILQIKSILTDEQFIKWEKRRQKRKH